MRVLFVNKYDRVTGGADAHCLTLTAALRDGGHEARLLAVSQSAQPGPDEIPCRVTHDSRAKLPRQAQLRVAAEMFWNQRAYDVSMRAISEFRPDVVHAHKLYPHLSVAPLVAARRLGVPVVQTLHDYEFLSASALDDQGGWIDRSDEPASVRALNTVTFPLRRVTHKRIVRAWIAVSMHVAKAYRKAGIDAAVVPNYAAVPSTADAVPFEGRSGVSFVSRLRPEKGVDHVLWFARNNPTVPVTVAGWGDLEDRVRAAADELPNLHFAGTLASADVLSLIRRSRVVVMPSLWAEPGAVVVGEAMAEGTPLVTYSGSGAADYVRMSGGGRVVEPSPEHLSAASVALLGDEEEWGVCSRAARRAALSEFSLSTYLSRLLDVYAAAAEGRRS